MKTKAKKGKQKQKKLYIQCIFIYLKKRNEWH